MTITAEIDATDDRRIVLTSMYKHGPQIRTLPGFTHNPRLDAWVCPLAWAHCLALRSTFGDELVIGPKLTEWAVNENATRIAPAMSLRQAVEAPGSEDLYPYQRAGVLFLATAKQALLADEQGTGKTRQAVMGMMQAHMNGDPVFPALVVCPNSTKIGWKREAQAVWPGLTVTVVGGSATQRRQQLEDPAHIYVMNWESLRGHSRLAPYGSIALKRCVECGGQDERITHTKCQVHERELNQIDFNTVVADEVHRAKDPKAAQTRALWAATGNAKYRFALSGTPIASAPDDLWSVLHWLNPSEWPSKTKFVDRMCDISFNAFGAASVVGIKKTMEPEFFGALDPRMRRMPKDLVLSFLPPVIYERRDVEMLPKQKKAYEQMSERMAAELDDGDILMTTNPMVKMMRLLQFSSSYAEMDITEDQDTGKQDIKVRLSDPSCKLDAFMNDLDDFGDESVVVFAVSRQLIEMLSARLEKRGIAHGLITGAQDGEERQRHMDDFQEGRTKFILCTIAAGGTGITLTKGSIAVYLQRSWSMIDNEQSEARVHRIGSQIHDKITIIDYVTDGTVEEVVIEAVQKKTQQLESILRDKDLLERLLKKPVEEKKQTRRRKKPDINPDEVISMDDEKKDDAA